MHVNQAADIVEIILPIVTDKYAVVSSMIKITQEGLWSKE